MIEKLTIDGFQAHQDLELVFDSGVNTIVGPSDAGKSSVLRALRWVALNEPSGDAFIRWGAEKAEVKVKVDGDFIVRTRGAGCNSYDLNTREFKAFGGTVPSEVSKLLGVSELNFQGQYDSPFWLGDAAGQVSRDLNKVVGLEIIDKVLSKLASLTKKRVTEVEVIETRLELARQNCTRLKFSEAMNVDLTEVEALELTIGELKSRVQKLSLVVDECGVLKGIADRLKLVICNAQSVAEAGESFAETFRSMDVLSEKLAEAAVLEAQVRIAAELPNLKMVDDLDCMMRSVRDLGSLVEQGYEAATQCFESSSECEDLIKTWSEQMGEECALCGQKINH